MALPLTSTGMGHLEMMSYSSSSCIRCVALAVITHNSANRTTDFITQRWIYRIDPKRVNEYGQVLANDADSAGDSESKKDR